MELIMWGVMLASLVGTFLNVKADHQTAPSVRLKAISFVLWSLTNAIWVIYDLQKTAYPQAVLMGCYFFLSLWGLWKFVCSRPSA
jgi:hypothetical protein